MMEKQIEDSLYRYLNAAASKNDLDTLNEWIKDPEHLGIFKNFLKTHFAINLAMNNQDVTRMKELLLKKVRGEKQKLKWQRRKAVFRYAAVFIIIVGLVCFYQDGIFPTHENIQIVSGDEGIILEHGNGEIEVINNKNSKVLLDEDGEIIGKQNGKELIYSQKKYSTKLVYNTLKIPYGNQIKLKLSDGTKVMLNAGSKFRYPVNFIEGEQRQVFLEGEAYFDVAHDSLHPFIVNASSLDIKVLGTKFNVANYKEDLSTEVVLVGGSVSLKSKHSEAQETILSPGQMGTFKKSEKIIETEEVNTSIYTAWTNGVVVFRKASFENILRKLERHYNVKIYNRNKKLAKEKFNATIDVETEDIEQVLEYFNKIYGIKYQVIDNEVIIN